MNEFDEFTDDPKVRKWLDGLQKKLRELSNKRRQEEYPEPKTLYEMP